MVQNDVKYMTYQGYSKMSGLVLPMFQTAVDIFPSYFSQPGLSHSSVNTGQPICPICSSGVTGVQNVMLIVWSDQTFRFLLKAVDTIGNYSK